MGVSLVPLLASGIGAGLNFVNTQRTANGQDSALADTIRRQGVFRQRAAGKVNEQVGKLQTSRSEDSRREAMDSYMQALLVNKAKLKNGLAPAYGSTAFRADTAKAGQDVENYAGDTAGLMARMDAPVMQRRDEAVGYGNLANELDTVSREAKSQQFLDDLMLRSIRRSAGMDALSALFSGLGKARFGGGSVKGYGVPDLIDPTGLGVTYGTGSGLAAAGY